VSCCRFSTARVCVWGGGEHRALDVVAVPSCWRYDSPHVSALLVDCVAVMPGADAVLLVFDRTTPASLSRIGTWKEEVGSIPTPPPPPRAPLP
jgi:hypothetical protein